MHWEHLRGLCIQTLCLDENSTRVRQQLEAGNIPASYGTRSSALIAKVMGFHHHPSLQKVQQLEPIRVSQMTSSAPSGAANAADKSVIILEGTGRAQSSGTAAGEQGASSAASSGTGPKPVVHIALSKQMPKRTSQLKKTRPSTEAAAATPIVPPPTPPVAPVVLTERANRSARARSSTVQARTRRALSVMAVRLMRPPLPRRRQQREAVVDADITHEQAVRPPLKRRKTAPTAAPTMAVVQPQVSANIGMVIANERTQKLKEYGTLKLQKPQLTHLKTYWEQCVEPLASLLRIRPYMLSRRSDSLSVQVRYAPAGQPYLPSVSFMTLWQYEELRLNLDVIGRTILPFQYLAFDLARLKPQDMDADSNHGKAIRRLIAYSLVKFDYLSPIARLRTVVVLYDVSHMVILATALYAVSPVALARDIADYLNEDLAKARAEDGDEKQAIEVNVREEVCGGYTADQADAPTIQGGMFGRRPGTPTEGRTGHTGVQEQAVAPELQTQHPPEYTGLG
eukprot:6488965-Amphidinium_carterae.1